VWMEALYFHQITLPAFLLKSIDHTYVGLFLGSLFCPINLSIFSPGTVF
jgi:hypothetical protein